MKRTRIYRGDVPDLILPDHLADWDVHDYWERERFDSMADRLGLGDTLWVIGAEHGYMAALWSRLVGDTVLVEPSPEFWPNIRLTWEANDLPRPSATVQALVGDRAGKPAEVIRDGWPACATGDEECPARPYRYLHNPKDIASTPIIAADHMFAKGAPPATALSIDVEGAELEVLRSAEMILDFHRPVVWCSIHPDLMARDYDTEPDQVHKLMAEAGYDATHLATDHEQHWLFTPRP